VTFAGRFAEVGAKLDGAVDAWNASVGSFDGRLVVTAKQIAELSGTSFAMPKAPRIVETTVRELKKVDQLQSAAATALPGIARGA
jgi:hypothetical protein